MYTSPLSTWRKSNTARLLSRWQAAGHVGLLTACWWIQQTCFCFCLFVCKLIWFGLVWWSNGINFTGKNNAAQEHVVGSAPFMSTHLHAREAWSGLKWLSLIHSCKRTDHIFLSQFCIPWGNRNSLRHCVGPSFLGYHPFWEPLRPRNSNARGHFQNIQEFILAFCSNVTPLCFRYKTSFTSKLPNIDSIVSIFYMLELRFLICKMGVEIASS